MEESTAGTGRSRPLNLWLQESSQSAPQGNLQLIRHSCNHSLTHILTGKRGILKDRQTFMTSRVVTPVMNEATLPNDFNTSFDLLRTKQVCNHGNRGHQITRWRIQNNNNISPFLIDTIKLQWQVPVHIPINKQYSSHHGQWSYQVIITWCNTMLPFWSMSNVISLNQVNHFRAYWTQTAELPGHLKDTFANSPAD